MSSSLESYFNIPAGPRDWPITVATDKMVTLSKEYPQQSVRDQYRD